MITSLLEQVDINYELLLRNFLNFQWIKKPTALPLKGSQHDLRIVDTEKGVVTQDVDVSWTYEVDLHQDEDSFLSKIADIAVEFSDFYSSKGYVYADKLRLRLYWYDNNDDLDNTPLIGNCATLELKRCAELLESCIMDESKKIEENAGSYIFKNECTQGTKFIILRKNHVIIADASFTNEFQNEIQSLVCIWRFDSLDEFVKETSKQESRFPEVLDHNILHFTELLPRSLQGNQMLWTCIMEPRRVKRLRQRAVQKHFSHVDIDSDVLSLVHTHTTNPDEPFDNREINRLVRNTMNKWMEYLKGKHNAMGGTGCICSCCGECLY
jgi:hypothetical protein